MAKARIVSADGAEVTLDGTPAEIAAVLKEMKITSGNLPSPESGGQHKTPKAKTGRATLPGLIDELIEAKFFSKPKGIGELRTRLADLGHHYPLTSLSGPMQKNVRQRKLRRFKQADGKYVYAQ